MRVTTLLGAVAIFSVGCATAVVPDGAEPDLKSGDDGGGGPASNTDGYGDGSDGGSSTASDGGKITPPKGDSGTTTGSCTFTGALATYDFTGESGDQTSTAAASKAAGVTAGDVKRTGVTAVAGSDSINASGWPTTTHADTSKYYTLTITPPSGCSVDITSISIDTSASGSGPSTGAVATSDDTYSAKTTFTTGATHSNSLSVSGSSAPVEIRIYGYSASSTSGTLRVESTLTVTGSLSP